MFQFRVIYSDRGETIKSNSLAEIRRQKELEDDKELCRKKAEFMQLNDKK